MSLWRSINPCYRLSTIFGGRGNTALSPLSRQKMLSTQTKSSLLKIPSRQLATCRYAVAAAAPLSYQLNSVLIEFISCPQRCPAHGCCLHASSPLSFVSKSRIHFTSTGSSSAKTPKSSLFATKSTTECDQALKSGEAFAHSDICQLISFCCFNMYYIRF